MSTITSAVETVRSRFPMNILKFPLHGPDNMKTGVYGLFRDDNSEFVGSSSVSDRYTPHTTDDVVALVESVDSIFDGFNCSCYFDNGHYVFIEPTKDMRRDIFGAADPIFPRLMIRAGYDGQAFTASMGYYRDLCRNLSMLRTVGSTSVSIRHTSGLTSKMEDLRDTFSRLDSSWESVQRAAEQMRDNRVNLRDFLHDIFGEPTEAQRSQTMHANRIEAIMTRVNREAYALGEAVPARSNDWNISGWLAYNAVQGYQQHDAIRRGNVSDWDRVIRTTNDSSVRKAEALALAM